MVEANGRAAKRVRKTATKVASKRSAKRPSVANFEMWAEPGEPGFNIRWHHENDEPFEHHFPSNRWKPFVRSVMQMIDSLDREFHEEVSRKARLGKIYRRHGSLFA
jgi:hypothetical protein